MLSRVTAYSAVFLPNNQVIIKLVKPRITVQLLSSKSDSFVL